MRHRREAILLALGAALIALVVGLARRSAEPPARCAEGMIPLGPRCCGEGQTLDQDRCAGAPTRCAEGLEATPAGCVATPRKVVVEGGTLHAGSGDWEALGVVTPYSVEVPAFAIDAYEVTEQAYARCVLGKACAALPASGEPGRSVTGLTAEEAEQFCVWSGGDLPTSDQLAYAMEGSKSRRYPWGDTGAVCRRAAFGLLKGPCGEGAKGPELAGSHPDGATPEGIHDLAGNAAEWTLPPPDGAPVTDVRGGSWADGEAAELRGWHRKETAVDTRESTIGFRCAYEAPREAGAPAPALSR